MAYIENELYLWRVDGAIVGFSVIPQAQTKAEIFCDRFPRELAKRKGGVEIVIENGQLVLKHPIEGNCSFKLDEPDAQALYDLLNDQGAYHGKKLHLERDHLLLCAPGFKIILEDYRSQGQKSEAIRAIRSR